MTSIPLSETTRTTDLYYYENDSGKGLSCFEFSPSPAPKAEAQSQSTQIKTVEVKNPSALTIKFTYKF